MIIQGAVRCRRKRNKSADEHHPSGSVSRYVANDVPNPQMLQPTRATKRGHDIIGGNDGRAGGCPPRPFGKVAIGTS
ncbi:hypothetical protein E2C01_050745 [Portunus trituberculatus]|uniref:Uncharacterized protein n=1 Tax=Portunus trituberculatus TaxID=210409 RepID=A0A5B7GGY5_PORTR|nr:hypothetical protein [Portunus trituberculatus]